MAVTQPAYVEQWDEASFPELSFRRQRVLLTIDGEVIRGHLRVAEVIVEAALAHNPDLIELEIARWITENKAADDADQDWHRRWADRLNENPALVRALDRGPDAVYDRAMLTLRERQAMRLLTEGLGRKEIAVRLNISESAAGDRLEQAFTRIHKLGRDFD